MQTQKCKQVQSNKGVVLNFLLGAANYVNSYSSAQHKFSRDGRVL